MNRPLALALLTCTFLLPACGNSDQASYDPRVDGVMPMNAQSPDLTILENQKQLYDKMNPAKAAPTAAPKPAAPAAPATPAAG